jgi:hypothetical protein
MGVSRIQIGLGLGLGLGLGGSALGKPVVETIGEAQVDFSSQTLKVRGAGAPDLHAPSAQVGRVKAERVARAQAGKQLQRALAQLGAERLGCGDPEKLPGSIERALGAAHVASVEWGSDGSVALELDVRAADLVDRPPPAIKPGEAVVARGSPRKPTLLVAESGRCAEAHLAPPAFASTEELRAARPDLAALEVVPAKQAGDKVVAARLIEERK